MSTVALETLKAHCRVTHTGDDEALQRYLDQAEDECLSFLDRPALPKKGDRVVDECDSNLIVDPASDSDDLAPAVEAAILLIAQAMYEGLDPAEIERARRAAETKLFPYRNNLGV